MRTPMTYGPEGEGQPRDLGICVGQLGKPPVPSVLNQAGRLVEGMLAALCQPLRIVGQKLFDRPW